MLDPRGQLLRAAVAFAGCSMPSYDRALWALRTRLDSWSGIGHVAVGMHHQGYDLQLTQYDERGWRATFYTTGMEHSPTSTTGTGWERTPWHATQRAAWEAWRWTKRRWYAIASAALLTVLPAGVAYWCGRDAASVVIYWLTALVVLAYSYETYGMRLQMIRQNEIAIQPLLITSIEARPIVAPGSTNRDALIIRNIG